ncbi:hypothetical protein MRX96_055893 [Rhipicephalus microplus]
MFRSDERGDRNWAVLRKGRNGALSTRNQRRRSWTPSHCKKLSQPNSPVMPQSLENSLTHSHHQKNIFHSCHQKKFFHIHHYKSFCHRHHQKSSCHNHSKNFCHSHRHLS